jgi:hypothetical protein
MRYTINIESARKTNVFRRNSSFVWNRCAKVSVLNANDYYSINPTDIIELQERDLKITIDQNEFEVESEMGSWFGDETQLHYHIYGFRQNYPTPPQENQLLNLLLNGDDSIRNILVLKTDGIFYLLQQNQILDYVSNPEYVLQFEGFQPNNGYVGATINNNSIRDYVQNIFKTSIRHWIKHLRDKELHDHADIVFDNKDQVDDILELFDKLLKIETSWTPDY